MDSLYYTIFHMETIATFLIFFVINIFEIRSSQPPYISNVPCDPYEGIIPVDPPLHRYTTYFMKLQQCQGADYNPSTGTGRVCSPTREERMNISVMSTRGTMEVVSVSKHVACSFVCKDNGDACNKYQTWNDDSCSCDCPHTPPVCGKDKEWRRLQCNCMCTTEKLSRCASISKEIDPDTCECIPTGGSTRESCEDVLEIKYVVIMMLAELVVLIAVFYVIYRKYLYTSNGDETPETVRLKNVNENEDMNAQNEKVTV